MDASLWAFAGATVSFRIFQGPFDLSYLSFDFRMASSSSGVISFELAQDVRNSKAASMMAIADFTAASIGLIGHESSSVRENYDGGVNGEENAEPLTPSRC
jgi:hypothetical protein